MRLEVKSTDRIGISQEILAIFAQHSWDLRAMEVARFFTYVHVEQENLRLSAVKLALKNVQGIIHCKSLDLLPSERRESHLQALLARIPDPIIDIDDQGTILAVNQSARNILENKADSDKNFSIEGQNIEIFIDQSFQSLLTDKPTSTSIIFLGESYLLDLG